jgi:hypothetical protein
VCDIFWGLNKIQNGGHCHGNQGTKNVKFTPSLTNFCSNVSCHNHIVSMATVAKFVQLIQIFLAYLVPLDVDVVPIKFHQFLFGE